MKKELIEEKVEGLLVDYAKENNLEIVDVEYVKEGSEYYLRIYADTENKITIDECVKLSRYIDPILDEMDFITEEYRLQVSSPGLDRTLKKDKDFIRYAGKLVEGKTFEKINGTKEFTGELLGLIDGMVNIKLDNEEILKLTKEQISIIKLMVKF